MRTAVIIQARMGSKRFPGKVLAPLAGKPVLAYVIERCLKIDAEELIVAVPHETPDELKDVARSVKVIEGPEDDVLERYFIASNAYPIDIIMRITADCPLIEPSLCDKVLALYRAGGCGYAAIGEGRTFPKGYGCEVFSKFTLDLANQLATDPYDREHVTPWMERNVRCKYLTQPKDESHLNYCVDVPEDIERLERILDERVRVASFGGG